MTKLELFRMIYIEELTKRVAKKPEEYGYPVSEVVDIVDKMIPALCRGGAEIGPAVKAALKRLGIPVTFKGSKDFFNAIGTELKEREIWRFQKRVVLHSKLEKVNAPEFITKSAAESVEKSKEVLKKLGVDWLALTKEPKWQADLLLMEDRDKMNLEAQERCGRCLQYSYDGIDYSCALGVQTDMTYCRAFEDSGEDFAERLQSYHIFRCGSCAKCKKMKMEGFDSEDAVEIVCPLKRNTLAKECSEYEPEKE